MKIAFRISAMGFGGAERVFLSVADGLNAQYPVEIHFVVDEVGKGETEHVVEAKGYQLISLSSKRTLKTIIPLKKYINQHKPDVLISAYPDTNFAALISAKLAHHPCKVIVSEHAPIKEHWQHASFKRHCLLNFYVRYGYQMATHILGVSEGLKNELLALGHSEKNVSFIHNPVRFTTNLYTNSVHDENVKTIIAVGRITHQKDYLTLLKAFSFIKKQASSTTKLQLVIVGGVFETQAKAQLDAFVAEQQLGEHVNFVGFTENVAEYYAKADIFVLSSKWEGFGNVLVEALAFGLPIVSTNCHYGPIEILENGRYGKLVPIGDWQSMAFAMQDVLNNPQQFNPQLQQKRSLDFSESVIAEKYWQLIQMVVGK
jgi:glycosyltransferase involved in cell wall biosynthesis